MYKHYITVGSSYFCGWLNEEPILTEDDTDCVYVDISEASDDYSKLIAQSYDAEINPCWKARPLYRINEGSPS